MPSSFMDTIAKKKDNVKDMAEGGPVLAIQGSFGGKSSFRRNLTHVLSCLRDLELRGDVTASLQRLWPARTNSSTLSSSKSSTLALNLIGRINKPFDFNLGHDLQHSEVSFLSDLKPRDFYLSIHRAHFLLAAIDNREYYTLRASSSIPAAFITNVPFVANAELLHLYPCIRDMPIHKRLNQRTQCASIAAALALSRSDYVLAQQELQQCGSQLWMLSQEVFKRIGSTDSGSGA
jgi:hypothetical protein